MTKPKTIAQRRPAETGAATLGVLAAAVGRALGLDADWTTVLVVAVALAPAAITWATVTWRSRSA